MSDAQDQGMLKSVFNAIFHPTSVRPHDLDAKLQKLNPSLRAEYEKAEGSFFNRYAPHLGATYGIVTTTGLTALQFAQSQPVDWALTTCGVFMTAVLAAGCAIIQSADNDDRANQLLRKQEKLEKISAPGASLAL